MSESIFTYIVEAYEHYRVDRRATLAEGEAPQSPGRLHRFLRWLTPNGGTLMLVAALIVTAQVWAKPLTSPANAPGPSATTVNYQGRLADSDGASLDGNYGMTFALYADLTGGSPIWGPESHAAVPVSDGLFSVGLGSQTSGGIPTTTWNGDRYLEIAVGGETLNPRELIRSVPIAGMALTVPDGAITSEKLSSNIPLTYIQSGRAEGDSRDPNWTLLEGSGSRRYTIAVDFPQTFDRPPNVVVSLAKLDSDTSYNSRIVVFAENITQTGFDLVFATWSNSRYYRVRATWIAYTTR